MEVLKNVFSGGGGGGQKAKNKKRKSGGGGGGHNSVSAVDVPRVRSSSSSSCIQESDRDGFVFVERIDEGAASASEADLTSGAATPGNVVQDPNLAARLDRVGLEDAAAVAAPPPASSFGVVPDPLRKSPPGTTESAPQTPGADPRLLVSRGADAADNFLTLKNLKGGFCLEKKLERKVRSRGGDGGADAALSRRWHQLDLDEFDYDFTLERSVLRDFS